MAARTERSEAGSPPLRDQFAISKIFEEC